MSFLMGIVFTVLFTTNFLMAENKNPKVVVVGAGLAGLTTAYRLQQQGMDVDIYEARGRVGGRILTAYVDGHLTELGGQSITDGGEAENMLQLIKEFGLDLVENNVNLNHFYFTGDQLLSTNQLLNSQHFAPENLKTKLDAAVKISQSMQDLLKEILEEGTPLYKAVAVRLAAYEGAPVDKLSSFYVHTLYHILLGGISAVHQGSGEEDSQLSLVTIQGGNALLTEKMAQALGGKIHLNQPLIEVAKNEEGSFSLTFQKGKKIKADILVLALPCSVYNKIAFAAGVVPADRLEAISSIQYGANAKMVIPFSESPAERIIVVNDQLGGFFSHHNLLTLYCTGEASVFSHKTISNVYKSARPMVELGFGKACPPFLAPVCAKDEAFVSYEGPVGYSWPNDPYVKGSYSYIAPGQEALLNTLTKEQGESVKALFAPISKRLYFAGEHTSILMDVPGTMEAACESGERVARMILNSHRG